MVIPKLTMMYMENNNAMSLHVISQFHVIYIATANAMRGTTTRKVTERNLPE